MTATLTTADALRQAKELIATPDRWCKGSYETEDGRCCALGAVERITETITLMYEPEYRALAAAMPSSFMTPQNYNDYPDTTHADVMAWFDRAIEYAEREAA